MRKVSPAERTLLRHGGTKAARLSELGVLGASRAVLWRSAGARVDPRSGSGGAWFKPNRPALYRRWLRRLPLSRPLPGGVCLATARHFSLRWDEAPRRLYTSVVRCAPPGNKPLPEELRNCAPFLDEEIEALEQLRVVVCLGKIAFDGYVAHLLRTGKIKRRGMLQFAHGAEYAAGGRFLLATYHPSLQNTNTGKLTRTMFLQIFLRARELSSA